VRQCSWLPPLHGDGETCHQNAAASSIQRLETVMRNAFQSLTETIWSSSYERVHECRKKFTPAH
jgi:hypothetical protein